MYVSLAAFLLLAPGDSKLLGLPLQARQRPADANYDVRTKELNWEPKRTALIIIDMWDQHWCAGASARVVELAPRLNRFAEEARQRGVLVIHAPSSCMKPYENHPARKRAQAAAKAGNLPQGIEAWCRNIPAEDKGVYPVDQANGGCDCNPRCKTGSPWKSQIDLITIKEQDAISDSGVEIWNLLEERGIANVMICGVHTNMCVLGRPFGLRNLSRFGKNTVLVRDLTDTMYDSRAWPNVSHCHGTELIVQHIEKFVCPTITSDQLLGGSAFRFKEDKRPRVVVAISEPEYKTNETLPVFAKKVLEEERGFDVVVLQADAKDGNIIPRFAEEVAKADLVLLSIRRRALPQKDLDALRRHLDAGKPLVGIRTTSHAFDPRGKVPEGHAEWVKFDPEVLGGNYTGHHGTGVKTTISPLLTAQPRPEDVILSGLTYPFTSNASLYKTSPLAKMATPLLMGNIPNQKSEPVAWTNSYGKARVFYTSLGSVDDFANPQFVKLLRNGTLWALGKEVPAK
jgi:type 1 glutamine amidotransferase/nicotinamidase-related amidase